MSFSSIKKRLKNLWRKFCENWDEAGEMQRRIDEARMEHYRRYGFPRKM